MTEQTTDPPRRLPVSGPPHLDGQTAIVTGAARGIGQAVALVLAEAGANVTAADVGDVTETVRLIEAAGRRALGVGCDVSRRAEVEAMVARTVEAFGRVDILVNNAGLIERQALETLDEATYDRTLDVILRGTYLCTQAVYPAMQRQGCGKIVNVASISGKVGGAVSRGAGAPGGRSGPAYAAAKGGVIAFARWVARDAGRYGICVNCVCPGPVETEMTRGFDYGVEGQPLPRIAQSADIAYAVLYFASPMSNHITGQTLNVDGGARMD